MWRRLPAVLTLFVLSPLIAEYLLGSLPVSMIGILPIMALMYGSGALLIREFVRRTGRGWPAMAFLACAYGFIEEGFVTQSLFNPNYLGLRLLDFGFIPALGTALPWLLFVITIHVAWSICTPVGLAECLFRDKRDQPWLGPVGLAIVSLMFLVGCGMIAYFTYVQRPFMATPLQFAGTAVVVAMCLAGALLWPKTRTQAPLKWPSIAPCLASLCPGSALMLVQQYGPSRLHWSWPVCTAAILLILAGFVAVMATSLGKAWNDRQRFSLMAGGFLTYAWVGFLTDKELHGASDLTAHAILAAVMCLVLALAGYRCFKAPG